MPSPGDLCANTRCGHPYAEHEVTDDEYGPCWHHEDPPPSTPTCACDAFEEL